MLILQMGVRDIDVLTIEVGEIEFEKKYRDSLLKTFGNQILDNFIIEPQDSTPAVDITVTTARDVTYRESAD